MAAVRVVLYDGNGKQIRVGVGPWEAIREWMRPALLSQDPEAPQKIRPMEAFFAGLDVAVQEVETYEECLEAIPRADLLITCKGRVDAPLLERAERLREVHILGYRPASVDTGALEARGIRVVRWPLTNFLAVAEHTVALILGLVKRLNDCQQVLRAGSSWMTIPGNIRLLREMTVGVLGAGEIGYETARLLAPFGCRLLYHDLRPLSALERETGARYANWDDLFAQSDVVSLHLPLLPATEGCIGEREFSLMKPGALFVNTARGKLVDEAALLRALDSGRLGGAGLDVFAEEPLRPDHPLASHPKVLATPHVGWAGPWTLVNDAHTLLEGVANAIRSWR